MDFFFRKNFQFSPKIQTRIFNVSAIAVKFIVNLLTWSKDVIIPDILRYAQIFYKKYKANHFSEEESNSMENYQTVLYNDEYHTYDSVHFFYLSLILKKKGCNKLCLSCDKTIAARKKVQQTITALKNCDIKICGKISKKKLLATSFSHMLVNLRQKVALLNCS